MLWSVVRMARQLSNDVGDMHLSVSHGHTDVILPMALTDGRWHASSQLWLQAWVDSKSCQACVTAMKTAERASEPASAPSYWTAGLRTTALSGW